MTIVIPEELVPLLRDGLYFDLHGQLEEAGSLVEPRGRANISDGVAGCLVRSSPVVTADWGWDLCGCGGFGFFVGV